MAKDPYVFTVLTQEGGLYFDLLESAHRWGWGLRPHFLLPDQGEFVDTYAAFIARKHLEMYNILARASYLHNQFLFLDAWDTLFLGPPEELPRSDLLNFSGSLDCYPEKGYGRFFPPGHFSYLNSGVVWGSIQEYLALCPREALLDQLAWTRAYVAQPKRFSIDVDARVALTIFGEDNLNNYARREGRWHYLPTGSTPLVVHAGGKWPMPGAFLQ